MKKWTIAALAIGLAHGVLAVEQFYVSPSGNNSNAGTALAPFQTIQQAASVMQPGDVCVITAGTYRETVTPANNLVTFQAATGAEVVVSGYEVVTNWTVYSNSIYQAQLTWNLNDENQLFYNDQMMTLARWPNKTNYNPFRGQGQIWTLDIQALS